MRHNQILTLDQIRKSAPSVFATQPHSKLSDRYEFIPTIDLHNELEKNGFHAVMARQTNSKKNSEYTRHQLRYRHEKYMNPQNVGDEIPEFVLTNAHDGSTIHTFDFGLYRLACSNGLMVASSVFESVKVKHIGAGMADAVIENALKIIEMAPMIAEQVTTWKMIDLDFKNQEKFAKQALKLVDSKLEIDPVNLLHGRRTEDLATNGKRNLFITMNVVQENFVRGGLRGKQESGKTRQTRAITNIQKDMALNKALWALAEQTGTKLSA